MMQLSSLAPIPALRPQWAPTPQLLPPPVLASTPAAQANAHVDVWTSLCNAASRLGHWLAAPYLAKTAQIGFDEFVQPNAHRADSAPPSQFGMSYQDLSFSAKDGTPLKGWYIPSATPSDRTVVLACGHGSQMGKEMSQFAPWLHKAGYNVVCFDFRNSGGSGGTQTTMGFEERWDLNAAITQAQARGGKNIAVMGVSMGAATAISEAGDDPRVKSIVADCPFDTLQNAVEPRVRTTTIKVGPFKHVHFPLPGWVAKAILARCNQATGHTSQTPGGGLEAAEPLRAISKWGNRPLFLIHGAADHATPSACSKNLAKAARNAQLWLVPGADHAHSYQTAPAQYQAKVLAFLNTSL
jgi:fermentation-respiration switch protein FrsA (DUF1100 family)